MMSIGSQGLDVALSALNDQLAIVRERAHLSVVGGSGLIAIDAVSRVTRDVDVVALERDGELVSAEPLPASVRDAAATVARVASQNPGELKRRA
jgi:16S rRNA G966 N2-methylase RsmD